MQRADEAPRSLGRLTRVDCDLIEEQKRGPNMACLEKDLRSVAYINLMIGSYVSMAIDMPCFLATLTRQPANAACRRGFM